MNRRSGKEVIMSAGILKTGLGIVVSLVWFEGCHSRTVEINLPSTSPQVEGAGPSGGDSIPNSGGKGNGTTVTSPTDCPYGMIPVLAAVELADLHSLPLAVSATVTSLPSPPALSDCCVPTCAVGQYQAGYCETLPCTESVTLALPAWCLAGAPQTTPGLSNYVGGVTWYSVVDCDPLPGDGCWTSECLGAICYQTWYGGPNPRPSGVPGEDVRMVLFDYMSANQVHFWGEIRQAIALEPTSVNSLYTVPPVVKSYSWLSSVTMATAKWVSIIGSTNLELTFYNTRSWLYGGRHDTSPYIHWLEIQPGSSFRFSATSSDVGSQQGAEDSLGAGVEEAKTAIDIELTRCTVPSTGSIGIEWDHIRGTGIPARVTEVIFGGECGSQSTLYDEDGTSREYRPQKDIPNVCFYGGK